MMLKTILIVSFIALAAFLILVAVQSPAFRLERSITMNAPSAAVFAQVNDFRNWDGWSPWAKLDPAMKKTFSGAASGVGAVYDWSGNNEVGEGRMTMTDSRAAELIRINLEFLKPFKASNLCEFTFKQEGAQTTVVWSMSGEKNFLMKAFHLFVSVDKMVGKDFEKGLSQLRMVAEGNGR